MNHIFSSRQRTRLLSLLIFLTLIISCGPAPSASPQVVTVDPLRFAEVVNGYRAADSVLMPRPNSVLFVGSSSIHGWKDLAGDFPELFVINRGLGGSHMSDLNYYLEDLVFPYNPNAIIVYEGDNDIAAGKSAEQVRDDFVTFVTRIRERWPQKPVFFISIKPSLARIAVIEQMAQANDLIKTFIGTQKSIYYVDVFTPMLGSDGKPRADIFKEDGLHMNAAGYAIWTRAIKKELGLE